MKPDTITEFYRLIHKAAWLSYSQYEYQSAADFRKYRRFYRMMRTLAREFDSEFFSVSSDLSMFYRRFDPPDIFGYPTRTQRYLVAHGYDADIPY